MIYWVINRFCTSCHDQINIWRRSNSNSSSSSSTDSNPSSIKLIKTIPSIIFDPTVLCYSILLFNNSISGVSRPLIILSTSSSVFTLDYFKLIENETGSECHEYAQKQKPLPILLRNFSKITFDHFQLIVFNLNRLLLGDMFQ